MTSCQLRWTRPKLRVALVALLAACSSDPDSGEQGAAGASTGGASMETGGAAAALSGGQDGLSDPGGGSTGVGGSTAAGGTDEASGGTEAATGGTQEHTGGSDEATGGSDKTTGGSDEATGGSDEATGGSEEGTGGFSWPGFGGRAAAGGEEETGGSSTGGFGPITGGMNGDGGTEPAAGTSGEAGTGASDATGGNTGNPDDPGACPVEIEGATGDEPGGLLPVCCIPEESQRGPIDEVFALLNEHRLANGEDVLAYDLLLEQAIQGHCKHMELHSFFDHEAPEASVSSPWDRAEQCGASANGENIAWGQRDAQQVMDGWKESPGHNENMLSSSFTRVGIGYYGDYWGQIFGSR